MHDLSGPVSLEFALVVKCLGLDGSKSDLVSDLRSVGAKTS